MTDTNLDNGSFTPPGTLRFERLLPGPIEKVWAYLVEPGLRAQWLAAGKMDLKPGGEAELIFRNGELTGPGDRPPEKYAEQGNSEIHSKAEIVEAIPPRLLRFKWEEGNDDWSDVTFSLEEEGDRVRLVLIHTDLNQTESQAGVLAGWHAHLNLLRSVLTGEAELPFWVTLERLEAEYSTRYGLPI